jgi:hypothetical protein
MRVAAAVSLAKTGQIMGVAEIAGADLEVSRDAGTGSRQVRLSEVRVR